MPDLLKENTCSCCKLHRQRAFPWKKKIETMTGFVINLLYIFGPSANYGKGKLHHNSLRSIHRCMRASHLDRSFKLTFGKCIVTAAPWGEGFWEFSTRYPLPIVNTARVVFLKITGLNMTEGKNNNNRCIWIGTACSAYYVVC